MKVIVRILLYHRRREEIIMNIKYYMRGVGTGVIVTAMIFLAFDKPKGLTDAEIPFPQKHRY